jgi:hypothetical protein
MPFVRFLLDFSRRPTSVVIAELSASVRRHPPHPRRQPHTPLAGKVAALIAEDYVQPVTPIQ